MEAHVADITFYTNPMSRGRIARWMLEELGEPYQTHVLQYGPDMKSPDYLAINPMGKVPAITHKGAVVTECAAICTYLADAFPAAGLCPPPGDPLRAAFFRWMFFAAGPVEAASTNKALGFTDIPKDRQGMAGYGSLDDVIHTVSALVKNGPWLLGERFSALDVYLGSQIGWQVQFGTFPQSEDFTAYLGRINSRPAAIRAREIDDALMSKG
jgi:glutathione S-transferase